MGNFRDTHFVLQKKYKPTKQAFWCTRNLLGIEWNSGVLDYIELPNILRRAVSGGFFAKGIEKCKMFGKSLDKDVENLDDHGCPKIRALVDPKADEESWICSSHPLRQKTTLHCADRESEMLDHWAMQLLNLKILFCDVFCQYLRNQGF